MSGMWPNRDEDRAMRRRMLDDPQFHAMVKMVAQSIDSGQVAIQDWRDAVNLAYTEWYARNVGPITWVMPND